MTPDRRQRQFFRRLKQQFASVAIVRKPAPYDDSSVRLARLAARLFEMRRVAGFRDGESPSHAKARMQRAIVPPAKLSLDRQLISKIRRPQLLPLPVAESLDFKSARVEHSAPSSHD